MEKRELALDLVTRGKHNNLDNKGSFPLLTAYPLEALLKLVSYRSVISFHNLGSTFLLLGIFSRERYNSWSLITRNLRNIPLANDGSNVRSRDKIIEYKSGGDAEARD